MNKFKILALATAVTLMFTVYVSASADVLSLYKNKETDNAPFRVENMFPGDSIEKPYCVRVSYNGTITVHFRADVQPQYEELAKVLECEVSIDGNPVYTGLLRDMRDITHTITGVNRTQDLDYKIIVSLDTSVGNEYQNKILVADFVWWVEIDDDDDDGGASGGGGSGLPTGPDTPVDPGTDPDDPDNPDVPDLPDTPGGMDDPNNPDSPHIPGTPGTDHTDPDAPGTIPGDEPSSPDDLPEKPTGELIKPPNTGDFKNPAIYITLICISVFVIFLILFIRKKNKNEKNRTIRRLTIALGVIIVLAVCLCVTTFALIYSRVTVDENIFRTGTVKINLNDEKPIIEADEFLFEPGMTVEKRFFIENESSDSVYYKIYFENIGGDLANVLKVKIWDKENNVVLYDGKAINLTVDNSESDVLYEDERRDLYATFHFPEESGNNMQNAFLQFDMCATATQTRNNHDREF